MSRQSVFLALGMWLLGYGIFAGQSAAQAVVGPALSTSEFEAMPLGAVLDTRTSFGPEPMSGSLTGQFGTAHQDCDSCDVIESHPVAGFGAFFSKEDWVHLSDELRFHHSTTDGRSFGQHRPIEGTSWLNRPYYVGLSTGGFFMTQGVQSNVRNDNDLFGAIHMGWDWDYFWGLEFRLGRSSPELVNTTQPDAARNDALLITDLSLYYYPAGDTVVRPYLRAGVGWTDIDFPNDAGDRTEASPFTMPLGMGVKWPVRRWLAARIELTDNLAFADSAVNTQQNFTLVLGIEYRFGAKPKSYWPWNPTRHPR